MEYTILHVEDYDDEKGVDYSKQLQEAATQENLSYDWADNLKDAQKKIMSSSFRIFVLDGQFPEEKGTKPEIQSFFKIYSLVLTTGIQKERIIAWSNSTTVHNFCYDHQITCFSKKDMKQEDYLKKGNDPLKTVKKIEAKDLISLIIQKLGELEKQTS